MEMTSSIVTAEEKTKIRKEREIVLHPVLFARRLQHFCFETSSSDDEKKIVIIEKDQLCAYRRAAYPVTVECTIDVETKRAYMASWIVAIFVPRNGALASLTQCSVLITCSNAFNNATNVSVLSEEATPFIPDSLRCAFDSEPVGYYPPEGAI